MTTVMEPGKWLDLRCSRCGETSIRRGLVRGVFGCLPSGSRLGDGNAEDMTGSSLFRNGPARHRRALEAPVRGPVGSAEGRRGVQCGDCLRRYPRHAGCPACARCRTGVCILSRGVAEGLGRLCASRHSRAARDEEGHRSVEGAEKACPDVTAGPITDTAEGQGQAPDRRAETAEGIALTARKWQRATPRKQRTTIPTRPDHVSNPCSQRPGASSQRPKNRLATWSRYVAAPDRGWAASATRLAAERSDLAAQDPRRTAREKKFATSGNFLATSIVDPEPALQGSCCVHSSTPLLEGGHRE
jgi:hypothetical protein